MTLIEQLKAWQSEFIENEDSTWHVLDRAIATLKAYQDQDIPFTKANMIATLDIAKGALAPLVFEIKDKVEDLWSEDWNLNAHHEITLTHLDCQRIMRAMQTLKKILKENDADT